jgi:hypothetical protein
MKVETLILWCLEETPLDGAATKRTYTCLKELRSK